MVTVLTISVAQVYLLMRKKKGKGPAERLSEMKEHFLFRSIDEALPGQLDKLHIVEGDCQVHNKAIRRAHQVHISLQITTYYTPL